MIATNGRGINQGVVAVGITVMSRSTWQAGVESQGLSRGAQQMTSSIPRDCPRPEVEIFIMTRAEFSLRTREQRRSHHFPAVLHPIASSPIAVFKVSRQASSRRQGPSPVSSPDSTAE
ncbi:hypothetical protein NUW54_g13891 [Trametes sanguinea]|uniref:Uncharacterized protein n=1 Tax=Trametes sanguinea TaxID=158606 RepID=A0ACC1MHQ3_9APHY|nr:hypothetical protein NUW54_g13891 [Trametes sanguinea]